MERTPPFVACVNCGTGRLRFSIAIVEWSSNPFAVFAYSMRMRRSVRTVKRAMPSGDVTTAPGFAMGL
jgi:hypothetical protein